MKAKKLFLTQALAVSALLCSCGDLPQESSSKDYSSSENSSNSGSSFNQQTDFGTFAEEEAPSFEADLANQTLESPKGTIIDLAALGEGEVKTITDPGDYVVKGKASNARIVVSSSGDVRLFLLEMDLTSLADAPIEVQKASSFTIHVCAGSTNHVQDSEANTLEAAIVVKKVPLLIGGEGYLYVQGNGRSDDEIDSGVGIQAAKGINITSTHLCVEQSVSHALNAKAGFEIKDAHLSLHSEQDGLHSKEGGVYLSSSIVSCFTQGDGIDAAGEISLVATSTHIETEGEFILYKSSEDSDGSLYEDSRYILSNGEYKKVASDEMNRYPTRYYLKKKCKGIKTDGNIEIEGGHHYLKTTDDGIASDSSITLSSGEFIFYTSDQAVNGDQVVTIGIQGKEEQDLSLHVYHSYEAIQGGEIHFYGGTCVLTAQDDGINGASDTLSSISVNFHSPSKVYVNADGDGIDSNGDLIIEGGDLVVFGPSSSGDGGLDADGQLLYTGGNLMVFSQQGMDETPTCQGVNALCYRLGSFNANSTVSVIGNGLEWSALLPKAYSSLSLIVGGEGIEVGQGYSLYSGIASSAPFTYSTYFGTKVSQEGAPLASITASQGLSTYGNSSRPGGGGGGRPGPH